MSTPDWPSVGVVLPTRDRPHLLRRAVDAVRAQDYPGQLRAVVVFDQTTPDESLASDDPDRPVSVLANADGAGLASARNTGIRALSTDLVGFCDDDDQWLPGKVRAQVGALAARPDAEFATCAIVVDFDGRSSVRLAGRDLVTYQDLLRSRMAMLHSSTYLVRRAALVDRIGLFDEAIPGSQNEDWDMLLRAAGRHPIVHVDRPLVRVLWGQSSYFARQWETKVDSLHWMLCRHPDIAASPVGAGRVYGQLAFAHAVLGQRGEACRWAARSLRAHWREPRAIIALAVAGGVTSGESVLRRLHRHGRGI